ncbi:hypothetical protein QUF74_13575 [Candidatus Halobeggiatoa sp. HSG11]|nr:hypothetical protein [Candidatus Halobeggiatoa sp. HSG11]
MYSIDNKYKFLNLMAVHWNRAISYLKIGLRYVASAHVRGYKFIKKITLSNMPAPEPLP